MLSFPSLFELTARYGTCCGGADGTTAFAPSEMEAWRSLGWEGVEAEAMPDLAATFGRVRELATIVDTPLPAGVEDIRLIGVDQRTPHQFGVEHQGAAATIRMRNTWDGDGTVVRESATNGRAVVFPTSFADHERILNDERIQAFLEVALSRGGAQAARTVPIKPRSLVRIVGRAAQLVGVAVLPDQPMYRTGDTGQAHIHIRLAVQQPLPIGALRLAVRTPNGQETRLALRSDPAASDPTNPFEQTFTGDFQTGPNPGTLTLRATVLVEGGPPRIVERPIAVIAQ
jgi:hypothetical protein